MTENEKYKRLNDRYGDPMANTLMFERQWMTFYNIPLWIDTHIPSLPNRLYINKDLVEPFESTMNRLISLQLYKTAYLRVDRCVQRQQDER